MTMVYVPGGSFGMGSTEAEIEEAIALCREHYPICNQWYYDREAPMHTTTLDAFWIDQTEVTNAQFSHCVEEGACEEPSTCTKGDPTYSVPEFSEHPVVCVDWNQAAAYCGWAGAHLPTEAEWEYVSRGVKRSIFPWGDSFVGTKLNYCDQNCEQSHADERYDDGYNRTAPASAFPDEMSWCGALGMGGNVSEWTADWFAPFSPEASTNPTGPASGENKMIKGCSWFSPPAYCRGSARPSVPLETRFDYLGFRCAMPFKG
jgi:formylglycine-generating enzyme required for sulfatase activity